MQEKIYYVHGAQVKDLLANFVIYETYARRPVDDNAENIFSMRVFFYVILPLTDK